MSEEDLLPIGEAARRLGVAVSALRYWDERGVVAPAERRGGQRWYGPEELHRLVLARTLQETGLMSLDEIALILRGPAAADWREVIKARLARLTEQLERLRDARAYLEHFLHCPNDNPATGCPYMRADTARVLAVGSS